ncbi:Transcriptional regulator [Rubellimicrobium thermophilum DSM 16684]|uniref:Transcriptional regulator n=1 Tax=Rubellimicrobium thermophilum DSM 16684 TaxID=1123069 RepID=S9QN21_9RHOB|nr:GntR family transcriptional regulator [Rubellimicrobium thermophilum]EPX82866.1 Transcriptional regulator [Rubellimicrobium thermophilum DSM 16684]
MDQRARTSAPQTGADSYLYRRVAALLSGEIAQGRIARGTRLYESRVAARFGISRSPARQALELLAREGVLQAVAAPSRGFVVADRNAAPEKGPEAANLPDLPLTTRPAWERIHGAVVDAIASRIVLSSWWINETALGEHFGVSRTVAREVLARLQAQGLVTVEGKRWIAPQLTEQRVDELYDMRAILECAALRKAAPGFPRARLLQMHDRLQKALVGHPSGEELDRLEADLHVDFLQSCPNRMLQRAVSQHQALLLAHRFFYRWTARMFDVEPFLAEHLRILDHVLEGRIDNAAETLDAHLMASKRRAMMRIDLVRAMMQPDDPGYLRPAD